MPLLPRAPQSLKLLGISEQSKKGDFAHRYAYVFPSVSHRNRNSKRKTRSASDVVAAVIAASLLERAGTLWCKTYSWLVGAPSKSALHEQKGSLRLRGAGVFLRGTRVDIWGGMSHGMSAWEPSTYSVAARSISTC